MRSTKKLLRERAVSGDPGYSRPAPPAGAGVVRVSIRDRVRLIEHASKDAVI
jgi:hypothetical protein